MLFNDAVSAGEFIQHRIRWEDDHER